MALFDTDMTKLFAEFKVPGIDFEAMLAVQRKNFEAIAHANQLALEGFQTIARRQAEIVRGDIEEASGFFRDLAQSTSTETRVLKQTEAARKTLEKSWANARELSEIAVKSGSEAIDVLNKRAGETLDEVRELVVTH